MRILPDSSVLIPYLTRERHRMAIELAVQQGRIAICSVVAAEIRAGARDRAERQRYDRFFALCRRRGVTVTPDEAAWHTCGRMLSRYRERYGSLNIRDH